MDNFRDDYYQILGVSETSSFSEIREKYILLSKKNHPDQAGSERLMQIINEAYDVLGNVSKKAAYDEFLKNSRTKSKFNGITEITTVYSSFSMPLICACCLKPYNKNIKVPIKSNTSNSTYISGTVKAPLCDECLRHIKRFRRKASLTALTATTAAVIIQSLLTDFLKVNPFLSILPAIAIVAILASIIAGRTHKAVDDNIHADEGYPINLFVDKNGQKKFTFYNPGYAGMFLNMNPGALVSNTVSQPDDVQKYKKKKRSALIVNKIIGLAIIFCLLTALVLRTGTNADEKVIDPASGSNETTAPVTTDTEAAVTSVDIWEGSWDTDFGVLTLKRKDGEQKIYEGTYTSLDGVLSGEAVGDELKGTYNEKGGSGSFVFRMDAGGAYFTGTWTAEGSKKASKWDGSKIIEGMETSPSTVYSTTQSTKAETGESTTETTLPYEAVERPDTGIYADMSGKENIAPLTIKTSDDGADYFVKLVNKETGKASYVLYIRGGEPLSTDIALGTYILRYASGETWYGEEYLFGPDTVYSEGEDDLVFSQSGNTVYGYTITLYKVAGGNFDTKKIDPEDFN